MAGKELRTKVGLDYWNVISHHWEYFSRLAALFISSGTEVHVVSAIGRGRLGTVEAEVRKLGVPCTAVHEVVFTGPDQSPRLKTAEAVRLGITVFYDDRDDVCRAMTEAGILAMRVTRSGPAGDREAERDGNRPGSPRRRAGAAPRPGAPRIAEAAGRDHIRA